MKRFCLIDHKKVNCRLLEKLLEHLIPISDKPRVHNFRMESKEVPFRIYPNQASIVSFWGLVVSITVLLTTKRRKKRMLCKRYVLRVWLTNFSPFKRKVIWCLTDLLYRAWILNKQYQRNLLLSQPYPIWKPKLQQNLQIRFK